MFPYSTQTIQQLATIPSHFHPVCMTRACILHSNQQRVARSTKWFLPFRFPNEERYAFISTMYCACLALFTLPDFLILITFCLLKMTDYITFYISLLSRKVLLITLFCQRGFHSRKSKSTFNRSRVLSAQNE